VLARARLVRKGRTVAVVSADVHQGEVQVATGLFTYIVLRPGPC
jgi:acyl-coenzyme A thioesterase PaaI-like protein